MGVAKANIGGNFYIGAFATSTDKFTVVSNNITAGEEKFINDILGTRIIRTSIDGSDLIGVYCVANSNGIMLPEMTREDELIKLKKLLPDFNIKIFKTDLNALKNNILVNDKIAIINPEYQDKEAKEIEDILDVEVLISALGGFSTVGANNILTNKGIVLNNKASDEEVEYVGSIIKNVSQTTANLGSPCLGLCAIANSNGLLIGQMTTGFELVRITDGLLL